MLIIKNRGQPATLNQLARAIQLTGIVPSHKQNRIRVELRYLQEAGQSDSARWTSTTRSRSRWPLIGSSGGIPRPGQRAPATGSRPHVYTLAIIGSGSTAAYYIDTLGPAHDHSRTIVIGEQNPWIHKRGQGISYVNHTWRQIGLPSSNITAYGGNESFANRHQFGGWPSR